MTKSFLVDQKKRHEIKTDFAACKFLIFLKDHKYEIKRKRTKSLTMDREFGVCIPKIASLDRGVIRSCMVGIFALWRQRDHVIS